MAEAAPVVPDSGGTPAPDAAGTGGTESPPAAPPGNAPPGDGSPAPASGEPRGSGPVPDAGSEAGGEPAPSISGGGGGGDPDTGSPASWPDNWREIMAGGDEKLVQRLSRFNSPSNVAKSWVALNNKMSSGEVVPSKPGEDATDDEMNAWRETQGIPSEPAGYLENMPEGLVFGEQDEPALNSFLENAHAKDMPPSAVHDALSWYHENEQNALAMRHEFDLAIRQETEDELRAEWGNEYRANLNGMNNLVETYSDEDFATNLFNARMPDGTLVGDNATFIRMMTDINTEVNPHPTVTPATGANLGQTIASEKAVIEKAMSDRDSEYWKGPKHPESGETMMAHRYNELLEAEIKLEQRAQGRRASEQG